MKPNVKIHTVKEINDVIKEAIQENPSTKKVFIKGEVSNFTHHSSGHMYFSLKDGASVLKIVMFRHYNEKLKFRPQNGMNVILNGDVTIYEKNGTYQVNATKMIPDGVGDLHVAYEQLKERLSKKGYFESDRKRPIPILPKTIGVITSPTGAAVQDIITTIQRRYPVAKILLLPVLVQGDQAASSISEAIDKMNRHAKADVLIVGRGGGSIEDLWAFNEEVVAHSIYMSRIPVISAVGHETDFTISDFVADHRAPTPTAAAELATAVSIDELIKNTYAYRKLFPQLLLTLLGQQKKQLSHLEKHLQYKHPEKLLQTNQQAADQLATRMRLAILNAQKEEVNKLTILSNQLNSFKPLERVMRSTEKVNSMTIQLRQQIKRSLEKKQQLMIQRITQLDGLSPLKIMSRGYSIAQKDGYIIKESNEVKKGDILTVKLAVGALTCEVINQKEEF